VDTHTDIIETKKTLKHKYLPFEEARKLAQTLGIKGRKAWRVHHKSPLHSFPAGVPAHPDGIYQVHGWTGWKNWLGTERMLEKRDEQNSP
jgi:hypothetical protein